MNDPAPYSVYVNGTYYYYSRTRARFVRWVLENIVGLSVSMYDHGRGGWYILQNSREQAQRVNAESRLREAQEDAKPRTPPSGRLGTPPAS